MNSVITGWSPAEAFKRTIGSKNSDHPHFLKIVERGELVAFGRRHAQSDREWIPALACTFLLDRNLKTLSASALNANDGSFIDILFYPILHAPNAIYFLENLSLKDAFWRFVLHDPEVLFLSGKAIKANPDLMQVYLDGRCQPGSNWEWPLDFYQGELAGGRSKESPIGILADPLPREVQQAADVVCNRYSALLAPLRQGKLEAVGDPDRSRGGIQILSSIWSHRSYFFDAMNGDVLQKNENFTDWRDIRLKCWSAVMLKRPQSAAFHVKPPKYDGLRPTTDRPQVSKRSVSTNYRVETTGASLKACTQWLVEMMRASSNKRTYTKKFLWEKAQEKWPDTLSERKFIEARDAAIRITGATAWRTAGVSKKSLHKSAR